MTIKRDEFDKRIIIGFLLIGDGNWKGGLNYQKTLLKIISLHLSDIILAKIFVTSDQVKATKEAFGQYIEEPIIIDPKVNKAGTGIKALKALIFGTDRSIEKLFHIHNVDVVFETARFFGKNFSLPCLSWIPDLQHKHLPHFFSFLSWWRREIGFKAQTKYSKKRLIILSSMSAQKDCEKFYPKSKGRTHVMRFTPQLDINAVNQKVSSVKAKYDLPQKYFYLPNHFWAHKNHRIVVDAIQIVRDHGLDESLPPVIMSGPIDMQNTNVFDDVISKIKQNNLSSYISYIGIIPYEEVLSLNAGSIAVINPSMFEGWSSSVEEAKTLGTQLILSKIDVHKEQAPYATFFDPDNASDLAEVLINASINYEYSTYKDPSILETETQERINEFSISLKSAIMKSSKLKNV